MPRRYVIALIKHETNTFSPIATPITAFGHGNGPAFGDAARLRFAGTNTPMGAYLDLATREGAEIVTPVAAEAWPSNKASRATFEQLVRPLEDAVRKGCDAALLDLHGAMVIEDCDDAEGEIVKRLRAIAPDLPIAVTLDYHTNLSADLVDNATVITGYKTYPHVDMYEVGKLAGDIMVRTLAGEIEPVMAWGWLPLLASIMRHAPRMAPPATSCVMRARWSQTAKCSPQRSSLFHAPTRLTPAFRRSSSAMRSAARAAAAKDVCDRMLAIASQRRAEYAFSRAAAGGIGARETFGRARRRRLDPCC
jgi:microcystin degradation protein MlrC